MELNNEFEVSVPVEQAWAILTDVERIAPCLPGAQLQEIEGDEYRGIVKVKVGPITAQYSGAATFAEKDDVGHKAVLKASGRDTRGAGNASALITATLVGMGERTKVTVHTDLTVTGKVAQFGRGVMVDVSAKLLTQFSDNLEAMIGAEPDLAAAPAAAEAQAAPAEVAADESAPAVAPVAAAAPTAPTVRKIDAPEPEAVNLLDTAGAPVVKRVLPIIGVLVVLFLLRRWLRSR